MVDKTKEFAKTKEIVVNVSTPSEASFDSREANLIIMILNNLMQNAIEAIPRGCTVDLSSKVNAQYLTLTINDTGS